MLTNERKKAIFEGCINAMEDSVKHLSERITEAKEGLKADNLNQSFGAIHDTSITLGQIEQLFKAIEVVHKNN